MQEQRRRMANSPAQKTVKRFALFNAFPGATIPCCYQVTKESPVTSLRAPRPKQPLLPAAILQGPSPTHSRGPSSSGHSSTDDQLMLGQRRRMADSPGKKVAKPTSVAHANIVDPSTGPLCPFANRSRSPCIAGYRDA